MMSKPRPGTDILAGNPRLSCLDTGYCEFTLPNPPSRVYRASIKDIPMHLDIVTIQPLIALIFGILILILPRILNYLVAIYLILIGLMGVFPHLLTRLGH
jgi:hypothetical protein